MRQKTLEYVSKQFGNAGKKAALCKRVYEQATVKAIRVEQKCLISASNIVN